MRKTKYSTALKTSTTPTWNYEFGVGNRGEQPFPQDVIRKQLWEAHDYKATLLWNYCVRVDKETEILCEVEPRLGELDKQAKELSAKIKDMRAELDIPKEGRDKSPESEAIEALKDEREAIYTEMKALRKKAFKAVEKHQKFFKSTLERGVLEMAVERDPSFAPLLDGCPKDEDPDEFKKRVRRATKTIGPRNPRRLALEERLTNEMLSDDSVPDMWKRLKEAELDCRRKNREARNKTECFTGTYLAVEAAVRDARRESYRPKIRKYNQTGKIGVQLTSGVTADGKKVKGLPVSSVFDTSQKFSLELLPNHKCYGSGSAERRAKKMYPMMARARFRVDRGRTCIEALVVLHRELPEDGLIKWAFLEVKKVGLRTRYELRLVIEAAPRLKPVNVNRQPLLAINFGYRAMNDGTIRLATTWDGKNAGGITLPAHIKEDEYLSRRLESYAGKHFSLVKKELSEWKGRKKGKLPDDLKEFIQYSGQWRKHSKLAGATRMMVNLYVPEARETVKHLWHEWVKERLHAEGNVFRVPRKGCSRKDWEKEDLFDSRAHLEEWFKQHGVRSRDARFALYLEWWLRKDKHLVGLSKYLRTRYKRRIREMVRVQVSQWRKQYKHVASCEWDMRKTARKPKPENDTRTHREKAANGVRQISGPGIVARYLKETFGNRLMTTDSKGVSKIHFECGGEGSGAETGLCCDKCGRIFDQDLNAARHTWKVANGTLTGTPAKLPPKKRAKKAGVTKKLIKRRTPTRTSPSSNARPSEELSAPSPTSHSRPSEKTL